MDETASEWLRVRSREFVELSDALFDAILAELPRFLAVLDKPSATLLTGLFAKEHGVDERALGSALAWMTTIGRTSLAKGQDAAFKELGSIFDDVVGFEIFRERFQRVAQFSITNRQMISDATRRSVTSKGLLPSIDDLDATIELRAVLGDDLLGPGQLDRRGASVVALEPVASFRLVLDSVQPNEVTFQCGRNGVLKLISVLQESLRRMDEVEAFVSPKK